MYKIITIGRKDYRLQYSVGAALYKDCVDGLTQLFTKIAKSKGQSQLPELLSAMSDIPSVTLKAFYAGLIKHHGLKGDRTVLSLDAAEDLLEQYIEENSESDNGNMFGVLNELIEQMENDGFFKQIGLSQVVEGIQETMKLTAPKSKKKA